MIAIITENRCKINNKNNNSLAMMADGLDA